jgi:hypothetical protein
MPSSATSAGRSWTDPTWGIEQQCPQCGACVCLEETDRLLVCDYCRVRLILAVPGHARVHLPPRSASAEGLVFVPYWRLKGQAWSFGPDGIRSSIVDMTRLAGTCPGLPPSLGVRPQAMRLRFVTPETPGRFARIDVALADALALRWKGLDELEEIPPFHRVLIGDTASLIYQPVRVNGKIEDAVLDRALGPARGFSPAIESDPTPSSATGVRFLPSLCPNCGGDLEGERDSLVRICGGCRTVWSVGRDSLAACPCEVLPSTFQPDIHLPFWRTHARVEGIELATYDDLLRHAHLPALGRTSARRDSQIAFWTPAFKIHPEHWARVARTVTLRQPSASAESGAPAGEVVPVTLSHSCVTEAIRVLVAATAGVKEQILHKIEGIQIRDAYSSLVYLPFRANAHEVSHPEMLVSMNRSLLGFGRNL